jgi:hypothetical protein
LRGLKSQTEVITTERADMHLDGVNLSHLTVLEQQRQELGLRTLSRACELHLQIRTLGVSEQKLAMLLNAGSLFRTALFSFSALFGCSRHLASIAVLEQQRQQLGFVAVLRAHVVLHLEAGEEELLGTKG